MPKRRAIEEQLQVRRKGAIEQYVLQNFKGNDLRTNQRKAALRKVQTKNSRRNP